MEQSSFASLGSFVARHPWMVAVLSLVLVGVSIPPTTRVVRELKAPTIDVPDRESGRASAILAAEFERDPARTAIAVFTSPSRKVADSAYREAVISAIDRVRDVRGVRNAVSYFDREDPRLLGSDGRTTYAVFTFAGTAEEAKELVADVRRALRGGPADPRAYLTGFPAFSADIETGSQDDAKHAEMISMPITLVLLLLVFGTLIAAGLPVVLGAAGLITAAGLIMLSVFGAFALADILVMKEIGVGVAVAVLLDATIVRVVLVPASMKLMGKANWWMPPILRWMPELSEGGAPATSTHLQTTAELVLTCSLCRRPLRFASKFCGYCGTPLAAPSAGTRVPSGARDRPPAPMRGPALRARAAPEPAGNVQVIPMAFIVNGIRRRGWIRLRACQVELGQESPGGPSITFGGMTVEPLDGRDPIVVELVNARVKL